MIGVDCDGLDLDLKILSKCFRLQIEILADHQTAGSRPVSKWLQHSTFWKKIFTFFQIVGSLNCTVEKKINALALVWFSCSQRLHCIVQKLSGQTSLGFAKWQNGNHSPIFADHPAVTYDQRSASLLLLDEICTTRRWQHKDKSAQHDDSTKIKGKICTTRWQH